MSADALDVWKYAATSAITALAVLSLNYFTGAAKWATRKDVRQILENENPYCRERKLILHQLRVSGEQIIALQQLVQDSMRQQAELRSEVETLVKILSERGGK